MHGLSFQKRTPFIPTKSGLHELSRHTNSRARLYSISIVVFFSRCLLFCAVLRAHTRHTHAPARTHHASMHTQNLIFDLEYELEKKADTHSPSKGLKAP